MNSLIDFSKLYENLIIFYTDKLGILGGFILAFIENFFPPIPIFAIVVANVSAFGTFIGFVITFTGHYLGAICTFLIIRNFIKPRVDKRKKDDSKFSKFEHWVEKRKFHTLLIILSLPFVPYVFLNFAAGLSNISKRVYILGLGIGNFLMTVFFTFVGVSFNNAMKSNNYWALLYPLGLMVIAYGIGKVIETKFDLKKIK